MVKKYKKELTAAAVILLIFAGWFLFPSDINIIKKQINTIAKELSFQEDEHPLVTVGKIKSATKFFASRVTATVNYEDQSNTKEFSISDITQHLLAFSKQAAPISIKVKDLKINVSPDKTSATANFSAIVEYKKGGEKNYDAQELNTEWVKRDSKWLLEKVNNVQVIYY